MMLTRGVEVPVSDRSIERFLQFLRMSSLKFLAPKIVYKRSRRAGFEIALLGFEVPYQQRVNALHGLADHTVSSSHQSHISSISS